MRTFILVLALALAVQGSSQNYDVKLIPDSVKQGANIVKRFEELRVEQKSAGRAKFYRKFAYTILNKDGLPYSLFQDYYNEFREIGSIDGVLFDAAGKRLKSVKKKDINDVSSNDGSSLMTDTRYKVHDFQYREFPFTVEYEVESEADGILGLPVWRPVNGSFVGVEYSKLTIINSADVTIRFKQVNFQDKPVVTEKDGKKTLTWEIRNVTPVIPEPLMPIWEDVTPSVLLAPSQFKASGYEGNMATWEEYGKYIYRLLQGRDELPDNVKQDIRLLTQDLKSDMEKVQAVYNYMQKNTRYVSIQLGIGGWQPFEAKYVAAKRYGDCKALSNYTVALLREANIKGYYVEIQSGEDEPLLDESFPSSQFNHVVACVPLGKDTIWLECTDPTRSTGYMGRSTGNRKAVLINESGGHIVSTPRYHATDNLQVRSVEGEIDLEGNLTAKITTYYTGEQQEVQHSLIHTATKEQREEYLNGMFDLPTYQITASAYTEHTGAIPSIEERLTLQAQSYASVTGKRIFIVPNLLNKGGGKLSTDKPRKFNIRQARSYRDVDSVAIRIPSGYSVEAMPKDVTVQASWGKYSISFKATATTINVVRVNERFAGTYPPSLFKDYSKFLEDIYRADRGKIVLVKKD
jgi:transglutaminase-like putative cysteine protease